ncbi:hypothetical protein G7054_g8121 [Neopestalotiopsis clavispora]|nr:hypothetical protein G7054_g8121 [Neopestalotiopsis clavispora]
MSFESSKESWKRFFLKPESQNARDILHKARSADVVIPEVAVEELSRMVDSGPDSDQESLKKSLSEIEVDKIRSYAALYFKELQSEATAWQGKRRLGWRKFAATIEEFAEAADSFLAGFSGVVEVIKLADSQYGNAASSVLALLFALLKVKASTDHNIRDCMQTIANRLPDLDIYHQVYADEHLARLLCKAYVKVIDFARAADIIGRENSIPNSIRDKELATFSRLLQSIHEEEYDGEFTTMTMYDLLDLPEYKSWCSSRASLLFLHGMNDAHVQSLQSWLSLAALQLVEHIRSTEDQALVAYILCRPELTAEDVLINIIDQLLQRYPQATRRGSDFENITHDLQPPLISEQTRANNSGTSKLDNYSRIISRILRGCPLPIYFILNQPELCEDRRFQQADTNGWYLSPAMGEPPSVATDM